MDQAKLLVASFLAPWSVYEAQTAAIDAALTFVRELRVRQGPGGLFRGGDNVDSPPDSAFTINDVCDVLHLIHTRGSSREAQLAQLKQELETIADNAEAALLQGGIHTPNHRWEISAALARLHRRRPNPDLLIRIGEWVTEGVDIDEDGVYSERSANYAAHVSNPSLTLIGEITDRPGLLDAVEANLTSTLGLIHPDSSVETVHSRRQDQKAVFSLAPYLVMYRRYAVDRGRGDFAQAAERALTAGIEDVSTTLAETLLSPQITRLLPSSSEVQEHPKRYSWPSSSLVVDKRKERTLVVYGGSDYPRFRRIHSGLANNPTFVRMFAGDVVLESIRLSREFFGLGPFRSETLETVHDGEATPYYRLRETLTAAYYHPLPPGRHREDGAYLLEDDGRFHAAMDFANRPREEVRMQTEIQVRPTTEGVQITIDADGPEAAWALELTFRGKGEFAGGIDLGEGDVHVTDGMASYRNGKTEVVFGPGNGASPESSPVYRPGEDYDFLNASDAVDGRHAYITGRSPGTHTVIISAQPAS